MLSVMKEKTIHHEVEKFQSATSNCDSIPVFSAQMSLLTSKRKKEECEALSWTKINYTIHIAEI